MRPSGVPRPAGRLGRTASCQRKAATPTGTTRKKAQRQPVRSPRKLPSGAPITEAKAAPPCSSAIARGRSEEGTMRAITAVESDQKPPTATPISALPSMKTA